MKDTERNVTATCILKSVQTHNSKYCGVNAKVYAKDYAARNVKCLQNYLMF